MYSQRLADPLHSMPKAVKSLTFAEQRNKIPLSAGFVCQNILNSLLWSQQRQVQTSSIASNVLSGFCMRMKSNLQRSGNSYTCGCQMSEKGCKGTPESWTQVPRLFAFARRASWALFTPLRCDAGIDHWPIPVSLMQTTALVTGTHPVCSDP